MNKKNGIEVREPIINVSPLYNPLGDNEKTEFSDEKSYQQMFNKNTLDIIEERNKKLSRLKKNSGKYIDYPSQDNVELLQLLSSLREDIKGEFDAIKLYENHIETIKIQEIKETLIHIVNEEREHVRELQELIEKYQKLYGNYKEGEN